MGRTDDEVEIRGRWKAQRGRVVHRYIDIRQLYTDAKVAESLCVGGAVSYKLTEVASNITNETLFNNVVPHTRARFPNDTRLCRCLGLALLYAATHPDLQKWLPEQPVTAIKGFWIEHLRSRNVDVDAEDFVLPSPVKKVPLVVYRVEDQLCIDEVSDEVQQVIEQNGAAAGNTAHGNFVTREQYNALLVQLHQMRSAMHVHHAQHEASVAALKAWLEVFLSRINNNVRRFGGTIQGGLARQANQANRQQAGEQDQQAQVLNHPPGSATLSPTPRDLLVLWQEYEFGIGGRKPARDFTARERNNRANGIKQKYYRRKVVWESIARQIRAGHTMHAACLRIRNHYGITDSTTQIINKMLYDKRHNRMPPGF